MAESSDEASKSVSISSNSPAVSSTSHPQAAAETTKSSTLLSPAGLSPSQLKEYPDLCLTDEKLPSRNISELWQRPLKLLDSNAQANQNDEAENAGTPNRKNLMSRTKLEFDHLASDQGTKFQGSRSRYRRSMSDPETIRNEIAALNPKRLKLKDEETSPYEDLIKSKPVLQPNNSNTPASSSTSLTPAVKKLFLKSQSDSGLITATNNGIMTALEKMEEDPTLIGDASTTYLLPIKSNGKHRDLKEITAETLANLLKRKEDFPHVSFKIIDCRYPYEFAGGHIRGALNLYTSKQIKKELLENRQALCNTFLKDNKKRTKEILIFHCEFSSQRGPNLCHYLRKIDRAANGSSYPSLYYPELYLLYGGYKEFFEKFPNLCDPPSYVPMSHTDHSESYRRYKSECKHSL